MVGGMVGKNDFAIRLIIYDVRSSWVRFLPEGNIVSTNLFFLESFEQISMYIEYGTPSCVSGGVPRGWGLLGSLLFISDFSGCHIQGVRK